ncbi:MAG: glycoside hydrolase family 3 C-terminal domain-containing protein, partial [Clostridia bacterium]|nr:glycoside hydrolase family 3 C-terminal domain-containing protein [Clostridia bacterium]
MDNNFKQIKKDYKRKKRKAIGPWKAIAIVFLVLTLILAPLSVVLKMFDNTLAAFVGGSFWELENEDEGAVYFKNDFDSVEDMAAYGELICQQVEAEGATLLMNKDGALPLEKGSKLSLFSTSSVNLVYGGTGSGNIDASKADDLKGALERTGFSVNEALWSFYSEGPALEYARKGGTGVLPPAAEISEAPIDIYTDDVLESVKDYSDAAIVVFSRIGGEGADMEFEDTNYLALDENERDLMQKLSEMKAEGKISKLVVLLNTANALQVDFLKDNEYSVDACLWIGDVGISGINAVAEILCGDVNPSGSLVDTYCYDNYSSPAMVNFKPATYEGFDGQIPQNASTYMIYQEGIYVGYKYYETRYEDYVMGTGNAGEYSYNDDVAYPFGYGLSYTSFEYGDMKGEYNAAEDNFLISVTVTNTGEVAGKETVQVYSQSPYTEYDKENLVEKASVALCGFAKTDILEPGASQTLVIEIDKRELASYDAYGKGTYILDDGDYYLTVATDAHDAVNNTLAAKGYTVDSTDKRMDADGNASLCYKWTQDSFDAETYSVSKNGTEIINQLSNADINLYEGRGDNSVTYLTRNDWEGTFPREITHLKLTEMMIEHLQDVQYDPDDHEATEMPTMGADNDVKLYDMIGLDYDDPKWDELLDQLTFDEMVARIGDSFHWRMPMLSVQAPGTRDENGPQGLTASLLGSGATQLDATAFTSEDVMAATFNTELMYEVGKVIGNNCLAAEIACLYGPGNNTHRTPYGGRNFEYYSEEGFLAGKISASEVNG